LLSALGVSKESYLAIDTAREAQRRKFRLRRFKVVEGILIITIPTMAHERLHMNLYEQIRDSMTAMGVNQQWAGIAATEYRDPDDGKSEGDSSGGPIPARLRKGSWPTLMIEAGYSESMVRLREDMYWWFSASDHQVKIVLLAKFYHEGQRKRIVLEKWVETAERETRRNPVRPTLMQTITMNEGPLDQATGNPSYVVNGGPLLLEFRLLFLRAAGPGEADIIVTVQQLEAYAAIVWAAL
jgi:hypothetical protein